MRGILTAFFVTFVLATCFAETLIREVSEKKKCRQYSHGSKHQRHQVDLTVVGPVSPYEGMCMQSVVLMETLKDTSRMSFVLTYPQESMSNQKKINTLFPVPIQKILARDGIQHPGRVLIFEQVLCAAPDGAISVDDFLTKFGLPDNSDKQVRIAYTMVESSRIPEKWVDILNKKFDAVVVPDKFLVDVYKNTGVTIPVFVISLGRNFTDFFASPLKASKGFPFIFACYSGCWERKNLLKLVSAFGDAFGNNPNVQLHLCWRETSPTSLEGDIRGPILSEISARGLSNVKIEEKKVDDKVYLQRFLKADCYVNIATAEGFSIQPREAMALGIPVIVTNNTAHKTICESGLVRAVLSNIEVPAKTGYGSTGITGVRYQCLTQDVATALRDVYDNYDVYLKNAPMAREWVRQYQYQAMAPLYRTLIKPKKVLFGTRDEIVGDEIITVNKKLIKKYKRAMK
jgi:glycosyltransferase involved in cell wall biosynthesis